MSETILDTQTRLESFIAALNPEADLSPGSVLSELLVKLAATLQNPIINTMDGIGQSGAIVSALASTTDTYNPIIDKVASNYNTSRNSGTKSTGKLKIVVTANNSNYLRAGTVFHQPVLNLNYVTITDWKATTSVIDITTDLQIVTEGGLYYFIVPVVAVDVGAKYQVSDQMQFTVDAGYTINSFVSASAYGSFTTGLDLETDKNLINRYKKGLSYKTLLNYNSILQNITTLFPNVLDISVVSSADGELTRSKHNAFGISILGMADVYVRSSFGPETVQRVKAATYMGNSTWSFNVSSDEVPGFYRVTSILPVDNKVLIGSYLNTQTFSFDETALGPANSITTVDEARFTKYQTALITFTNSTDVAVGTIQEFNVTFSYQPNIADIQNIFLSSTERIICADYLVKSALPCYVSMRLKLHRKNNSITLPIESIKQDIFNYVNSIPFGESLYVSHIIDICHKYDVKYVELPLVVNGEIYTNAGTTISISDSDILAIPTKLSSGVSSKTTAFFIDYFSLQTPNKLTDSIGIDVY